MRLDFKTPLDSRKGERSISEFNCLWERGIVVWLLWRVLRFVLTIVTKSCSARDLPHCGARLEHPFSLKIMLIHL